MAGKAQRLGRPTKKPRAGERIPLGLRVTAEAKRRLDAAAQRSGRSQSQEAELRIAQSFHDEDRAELFSELYYGRQLSGLLELLGHTFRNLSVASNSNGLFDYAGNWMSDPYVFDQAVRAANLIFEAIRPAGDPTLPYKNAVEGGPVFDLAIFDKYLGEYQAKRALNAIGNPDHIDDVGERARDIRDKLKLDWVEISEQMSEHWTKVMEQVDAAAKQRAAADRTGEGSKAGPPKEARAKS